MVAIIPMKAHSERIPRKNFRSFNGKPLFYWIFETLTKVSAISKIVLDTDSEKLGKQVRFFFPDVVISLRPEELRGDMVSVNKLLEFVIEHFSNDQEFLQTHSTNPCLQPTTISNAIKLFHKGFAKGKDSLFTVNKFKTRFWGIDGSAINHDPNNLIRTQDLEPYYEENSNLYLFTRESFFVTNARIGGKPQLFEMNPMEAIDIDTEADFKLAEIIHREKLLAKE